MKAVTKYRQFHGQEPRKIGEFHPDLAIPEFAYCVGDATQVLYRSDKLNPTTLEDEGWIDYFHDHDPGVKLYRCDRAARNLGRQSKVPRWLRDTTELTWLGKCLGFSYKGDDGKVHDAKGKAPLPELYCTPSGKALVIIQNKRHVLALTWGGRLGVEQRGIVH